MKEKFGERVCAFVFILLGSFFWQKQGLPLLKKTEVYGHRGARALYPENTMEAYEYAASFNIDFVDMDVGVTKDGIVVVTHDLILNSNLVSHNGRFISVSENDKEKFLLKNLSYSDLTKFNVGKLNKETEYGKFFLGQKELSFAAMPKAVDVIDRVNALTGGRVKFQFEMKTDPAHPENTVSPKEFAEKIYAILREKNLVQTAEIQSFDWRCLYELQKLNPNIKTAYLTSRDTYKELTSSDKKIRTLWSGGKDIAQFHDCIPCMIAKLGGKLWDPEDVEVTQENLKKAHELGLKVVAWSWPEMSKKVFDEKMNEKLMNWGIDGIITDDPKRLIDFRQSLSSGNNPER